jgi:DNA-binding NarL/FixJ family response regulator
VRGAGAVAVAVRTGATFEAALADVDRAIVDLTARAYDGIAAIESASAAGRPVLAVGQHDDRAARQRALAAGAERVYAYRRLSDDGPRQIGAWLAPADAVEPAR